MTPINEIPLEDIDAAACREFWGNVLLENWKLANGGGSHVSPPERDSAISWIGSRDFHMVCALAGVDPEPILDLWAAGAAWEPYATARTTRGRYQENRVTIK